MPLLETSPFWAFVWGPNSSPGLWALGSFATLLKRSGGFLFKLSQPPPSRPFAFHTECLVFHWHAETFDLPDGAVRLVKSAGCENQAFQLKQNVIGLQFHLETTPESAMAILENCRAELIPEPYVQTEQELRAIPASRYKAINGLMDRVLAYLSRAAG